MWCFCLFWLGESIGLSEMQLSPTFTQPFPLDSVVQLLFYLLGIDKCQ